MAGVGAVPPVEAAAAEAAAVTVVVDWAALGGGIVTGPLPGIGAD